MFSSPVCLPSISRRSLLRAGALTAAAATLRPAQFFGQAAAPAQSLDRAAQMRQAAASVPIKITPLRNNLYLLQGAGGNMVAQTGPDGVLLIDTSFSTAVPHIREALASLTKEPLKNIVNTHWHFDHTDGNEGLHTAGVSIFAQTNTYRRLSTEQQIRLLDMHFPASPKAALPTHTFEKQISMKSNGEEFHAVHFDPAHTDSDLYIHFPHSDVLHIADIWFNGVYPLIDDSSGGKINGMVAACDQALPLAGPQTKIIPGHGPLGDKAGLQSYRDMLATIRDRVSKLKTGGATLEEAVASKPTTDLDSVWGKGAMTPDIFTAQVYRTL